MNRRNDFAQNVRKVGEDKSRENLTRRGSVRRRLQCMVFSTLWHFRWLENDADRRSLGQISGASGRRRRRCGSGFGRVGESSFSWILLPPHVLKHPQFWFKRAMPFSPDSHRPPASWRRRVFRFSGMFLEYSCRPGQQRWPKPPACRQEQQAILRSSMKPPHYRIRGSTRASAETGVSWQACATQYRASSVGVRGSAAKVECCNGH